MLLGGPRREERTDHMCSRAFWEPLGPTSMWENLFLFPHRRIPELSGHAASRSPLRLVLGDGCCSQH